jgi:hypothetical protein
MQYFCLCCPSEQPGCSRAKKRPDTDLPLAGTRSWLRLVGLRLFRVTVQTVYKDDTREGAELVKVLRQILSKIQEML